MSDPFNAKRGLVIVYGEVEGPKRTGVVRLALDTGATRTVINATPLVGLGYDPAGAIQRTEITTGSGVEYAAVLSIRRIRALGQERFSLPVLCHTLPPSAEVDGLLGLDFLRGKVLTVDFVNGRITLSAPPSSAS